MQSAEGTSGPAIVALVAELEASIEAAETALVSRTWPALEMLLSDQRRITHAISNAVALSDGVRPAAFDVELRRRLRAVETRRADQARRLQAFHDAVGSRLAVMARAKAMRRATRPPQVDRPALLDSRQ